MLKPITNWSDLQRALRARGETIYLCEDCGRPFIASASEPPLRCNNAKDKCRAWANYSKRAKAK